MAPASAEKRHWRAVLQRHRPGIDFAVQAAVRDSRILLMAPHGGRIEPMTDTLASAVAGERWSTYCFLGKMPRDNRRLHIPSRWFDPPGAREMARAHDRVITLHGMAGTEPLMMIGGRASGLARKLSTAFHRAGFRMRPPSGGLRGVHPDNICNQGRLRRGVQIEISAGLRSALAEDPSLLTAWAAITAHTISDFTRNSH